MIKIKLLSVGRNLRFSYLIAYCCLLTSVFAGCNFIVPSSETNDSSLATNRTHRRGHTNEKSTQSQFMNLTELAEIRGLWDNLRYKQLDFSSFKPKSSLPIKIENQDVILIQNANGQAEVCKLDNTCASLQVAALELNHFTWHSSGKIAFSAKRDHLVVYDITNKRLINASPRLADRLSVMSFSENGESVYAGTLTGKIYNWYYLPTATSVYSQLTRYSGLVSILKQIIVHPSDRVFFTIDLQGKLGAWQNFEAKPFEYQQRDNPFDPVFWSEEAIRLRQQLGTDVEEIFQNKSGEKLLIHFKDGRIDLWNLRGFEKLCQLDLPKVKKVFMTPEWDRVLFQTREESILTHLDQINVSQIENSFDKFCPPIEITKQLESSNFQDLVLVNQTIYGLTPSGFIKIPAQ